jgi:hypothetical protein
MQAVCENYASSVRATPHIHRVGQNRMYTPYMTVYLAIFLPIIPYTVYTPYIYGSDQPYTFSKEQKQEAMIVFSRFQPFVLLFVT